MSQPLLNISFYKFTGLQDLPALKAELKALMAPRALRGTILLSEEGINGFIAGQAADVRALVTSLRERPEFADLEPKESWSSCFPFNRLLVKIKKEIIPMGRPDIRPHEMSGRRLAARELKRWLDEGRDVLLLDTRNDYEIAHGTFTNARTLGLSKFRQFNDRLASVRDEAEDRPVVMFCTGGIRCEKATALAVREGFNPDRVFQLEGGILKYFEEVGGAHYDGKCFVFDNRVAVDSQLAEHAREYSGHSPWSGETPA